MTALAAAAIQKTPDVCGGDARVRTTRIPVWLLVLSRRMGRTDAGQLEDYSDLSPADLDASWDYYRDHPVEIEQAIWFNDTAANVPPGTPPPAWVLVSGRLLGLPDDQIREAFDPPLSAAELSAAWATYRADPARLNRHLHGRRDRPARPRGSHS